jgi:hypothetical protein
MGKEHLNSKENYTPLPHYKGYYIDKVYRKICFKNSKKEWLYCKKVDNKPGYVYIYSDKILIDINERTTINGILGKEQTKDGRYKDDTDTGIMSKQTVGIPIKKEKPIPVVYKDSPKDMSKQRKKKRKGLL